MGWSAFSLIRYSEDWRYNMKFENYHVTGRLGESIFFKKGKKKKKNFKDRFQLTELRSRPNRQETLQKN